MFHFEGHIFWGEEGGVFGRVKYLILDDKREVLQNSPYKKEASKKRLKRKRDPEKASLTLQNCLYGTIR